MAIRRTRRSTARTAAKGARKTTGRRTTGRRTGAKALPWPPESIACAGAARATPSGRTYR